MNEPILHSPSPPAVPPPPPPPPAPAVLPSSVRPRRLSLHHHTHHPTSGKLTHVATAPSLPALRHVNNTHSSNTTASHASPPHRRNEDDDDGDSKNRSHTPLSHSHRRASGDDGGGIAVSSSSAMSSSSSPSSQRKDAMLEDRYTLEEVIGSGSYGVVWRAKERFGARRRVAVKLNMLAEEGRGLRSPNAYKYVRDLQTWAFMSEHCPQHVPPIMSAFPRGSFLEFAEYFVVSELMETDLRQTLKNHILSTEQIRRIMYQLCVTLHKMHSAKIVHRDIKPANILVNHPSSEDVVVKLCDFGLARGIASMDDDDRAPLTDYVYTRYYRPPEVLLLDTEYTCKADVWALGCVFLELFRRRPAFVGSDDTDQLLKVVEFTGTPMLDDLSPGCRHQEWLVKLVQSMPRRPPRAFSTFFKRALVFPDPLAVDLMYRMLEFNPERRCSMAQALRHPYFASVRAEGDLRPLPTFDDVVERCERTESNMRTLLLHLFEPSCPSMLWDIQRELSQRESTYIPPLNADLFEELLPMLEEHRARAPRVRPRSMRNARSCSFISDLDAWTRAVQEADGVAAAGADGPAPHDSAAPAPLAPQRRLSVRRDSSVTLSPAVAVALLADHPLPSSVANDADAAAVVVVATPVAVSADRELVEIEVVGGDDVALVQPEALGASTSRRSSNGSNGGVRLPHVDGLSMSERTAALRGVSESERALDEMDVLVVEASASDDDDDDDVNSDDGVEEMMGEVDEVEEDSEDDDDDDDVVLDVVDIEHVDSLLAVGAAANGDEGASPVGGVVFDDSAVLLGVDDVDKEGMHNLDDDDDDDADELCARVDRMPRRQRRRLHPRTSACSTTTTSSSTSSSSSSSQRLSHRPHRGRSRARHHRREKRGNDSKYRVWRQAQAVSSVRNSPRSCTPDAEEMALAVVGGTRALRCERVVSGSNVVSTGDVVGVGLTATSSARSLSASSSPRRSVTSELDVVVDNAATAAAAAAMSLGVRVSPQLRASPAVHTSTSPLLAGAALFTTTPPRATSTLTTPPLVSSSSSSTSSSASSSAAVATITAASSHPAVPPPLRLPLSAMLPTPLHDSLTSHLPQQPPLPHHHHRHHHNHHHNHLHQPRLPLNSSVLPTGLVQPQPQPQPQPLQRLRRSHSFTSWTSDSLLKQQQEQLMQLQNYTAGMHMWRSQMAQATAFVRAARELDARCSLHQSGGSRRGGSGTRTARSLSLRPSDALNAAAAIAALLSTSAPDSSAVTPVATRLSATSALATVTHGSTSAAASVTPVEVVAGVRVRTPPQLVTAIDEPGGSGVVRTASSPSCRSRASP